MGHHLRECRRRPAQQDIPVDTDPPRGTARCPSIPRDCWSVAKMRRNRRRLRRQHQISHRHRWCPAPLTLTSKNDPPTAPVLHRAGFAAEPRHREPDGGEVAEGADGRRARLTSLISATENAVLSAGPAAYPSAGCLYVKFRATGRLGDGGRAGRAASSKPRPPARREVQSRQPTHCPRSGRLVGCEVVGNHQERCDC